MQHYTAPSGAQIHVGTHEQAGQRAMARGGPKEREHSLWSFAATTFDYSTVLDIGANYGQVSLASRYPKDVEILLVEANPQLLPYLEKTIATHPNRDQITLHNVALGDRQGTATLYVRNEALGKSSLIREQGDATAVEMATLDHLAPPEQAVGSAILKIDVEGSELAVLDGAANKLASLDDYAIMIELHPGFMRRTAPSVGAYLERLCDYGFFYELASNEGQIKSFDFARFVRRGQLHDILIVSGERYNQAIREHNRLLRSGTNGRSAASRSVGSRLRRLRRILPV